MIVPKLVYKPLLNEVIEGHDYAVLHLESAPDKNWCLRFTQLWTKQAGNIGVHSSSGTPAVRFAGQALLLDVTHRLDTRYGPSGGQGVVEYHHPRLELYITATNDSLEADKKAAQMKAAQEAAKQEERLKRLRSAT